MRVDLPGLTTLRFFAALWVVLYHLAARHRFDLAGPVATFIDAGPAAVSFFFVLSGFLMSTTYIHEDGTLTTTKRTFWRARVARIVPVLWLALLVMTPVLLALAKKNQEPVDVVGWVLSASLLQAFVPGHELAGNPPAWSLSVEALFYAVFPWVGPALAKAKRPSAYACVFYVCSVAPCAAYVIASADVVDRDAHAPVLDVLKYHPLVRLPELLLGVLAGRAWLRGFTLDGSRGLAAAVGAAVVVVIACATLPWLLVHNGLLAPAFIVIIVAFASNPTWLSSSILVRLGASSYALYLLHVPLLLWIAGLSQRRTGQSMLEDGGGAATAVCFCVFASVVVFSFFEEPLRRKLR